MAKVALKTGNIRVEENQKADFVAFLRSHFGKHRERVPGPEGERPEFIDRDYTEDELGDMMTREHRQMWRDRYRNWKRAQADADIDLS